MLIATRNLCLSMFILATISGCSHPYFCMPMCNLTCVSVIDRDGFTSTITSAERLNQYANVDFLTPQSYQKVMCIYQRDECGNIPGSITSYYPNGQVKQYLDIVNSRALGDYKEWHDNGARKLECRLIGGLGDLNEEAARTWIFDGCCRAWTCQGTLEAEIPYEMGFLQGEAVYFHPNGVVRRRTAYNHGLIDGDDITYTECGDVLESSHYVCGKLDGPTRRFWKPDQPAAEECFKNGSLITGRYWDPRGQLIAQVNEGHGYRALFDSQAVRQLQEYRFGLPEGLSKIFDPKSDLSTVSHIKDGKRHGEEIVYYPTRPGSTEPLRPKLSIMWYEDKIHGIVKSWYPDGMQESQREMSNNKRNGLSTAWYRNGSVMLVEEYEHDKLIKGEYFKKGERRPESKVTDGNGIATLYDADGNLLQKVHYYHGKILD